MKIEKCVVRAETSQGVNRLLTFLESAGYEWYSGNRLTQLTYFDGRPIYYEIGHRGDKYISFTRHAENVFSSISVDEFMAMYEPISLDIGDVL